MEGAHKRQRELVDTIVGDKEEAARKRRRAQAGVAAAGRCGQSIQAARARKAGLDMKVINKDADDALKAGSGLVQASLEHLDEAERSWDKFVAESGMKIKSYPTEKQVAMYMSAMSRTRQRECLAQRGKRRKGRQNTVVRNYVAEMGNNLWSTKYPAFAKLDAVRRKDYWSKIFKAYKSLYAKASAEPETEVDEERAEQLVAQTEKVYQRDHVYRTEVFQLQDLCIGEKEDINRALVLHSAIGLIQSTAARVGMFTKTRHDAKTARWSKEHPMRVKVRREIESSKSESESARRRAKRTCGLRDPTD